MTANSFFTRCALTLIFVQLLLGLPACGRDSKDPGNTLPEPQPEKQVRTYTTTANKSKLFQEASLSFDTKGNYPTTVALSQVELQPKQSYQTIDGFGAAMTWASCYNLLQMPAADRIELLKSLFAPEGLGIGLIRVSMGASDFNLEEYTWCDEEGLENFNVDPRDRDVLFPVLKEIYTLNPEVKIIASPWSCPRWMKQRSVSDPSPFPSWTSGSLRRDCYAPYAQYFVKWIQTMEGQGFHIYAVTVQNEPLNHGNSMSLYMTWAEQRDFIKEALGPAFAQAGLQTKILLFDHNYNYDNQAGQKNYPLRIYADADASRYVAGSAWHNYGGSFTELDNIVQNAPDKEIYFTEASIGSWNYNFGNCLVNDFHDIFMQTLARGCKGITLWNMVLDNKNGPYSPAQGSCKTCYGVLTLNPSSGAVIDRTSHYYNIAHAAKVIRPGALRIEASGRMAQGLLCQAYLNPDGSYGVLVLNRTEAAQLVVLKSPQHSIESLVPAKAIHSLHWRE